MRTLWSFVKALCWLVRERLVNRHNLRAVFLQHCGNGDWVGAFNDLSDDEFNAYLKAIQ